ncbi:MAG TPA: acyltransferase domain-containing protein, partial [Arenibaculum sp.]|nr:acyltransferase domain-containing protein [Arenibaculum sp.]
EARGLKLLMQETGALVPGDRIAFGSVKSQIGHTKAAAGAASAIKVALALHHKVLPPTINVKKPDPKLGLEEGPLYLNTQARPWFVSNGSGKRRAGVSSFGFGGTNFHLVLEEAPASAVAAARFDATPRPVVVAAVTPEALLARCRQLVEAVGPDAWPFDASAPAAHARLGFAAQDDEERRSLLGAAIGMLESSPQSESWRHPKGATYRRRAIDGAKVAALFAGQGAQHPDMGLTAMNAFPEMRAFVERIDPLFANAGEAPLSSVMYPVPAFDDEKRAEQADVLRRTRYAQTAIGALAAGQFRLFERAGLRIDMAGGHSFGELAALWAAGALDDATFVSLAKARGDAMTPPADPAFDPGTMVAVVGSADDVQALIDRSGITGLQICNFNTPRQQVVGGGGPEIEAFEALLDREGVKYSRLKVSGAFHTARLDHAVGRFAAAVDGATTGVPALPVYANRNGAPYAARPEAVKAQLKAQLREPVRFADLIEAMWRDGARVFVEFGPRDTLSKMVSAVLGDRPHVVVPLDKGNPAQAVRRLMEAAAELTVAGVQLADPDHQRAPVAAPEPPKKGIVKLNGMNYVSDARRKAFASALEAGEAIVARHREQAAPPPGAAATPPTAPAVLAPGLAPVLASGLADDKPVVPEAAFAAAGPVHEAGRPVAMAAPAAGVLSQAALLERSDTLADGMTVRFPSPGPVAVAPVAAKTATPEVLVQTGNETAGNETAGGANGRTAAMFGELARSHAELHGEYLAFQQNVLREVMSGLDDGQSDLLTQVRRSFYQASEAHRAFMDGVVEFGRLLVGESEPIVTNAKVAPVSEPVAPAAVSPVSASPVSAAPVATAPSAAPAVPEAALEAAKGALLEIVAEKTGYPSDVLDLDMDMEADLGIDSIKRVEILGALRERHPDMGEPDAETLAELRTLRQVLSLAGGAAPTAPATPAPAIAPASTIAPAPSPVAEAAAPAVPEAALEAAKGALLEIVAEKTGYP